jgi:hypothetical protein
LRTEVDFQAAAAADGEIAPRIELVDDGDDQDRFSLPAPTPPMRCAQAPSEQQPFPWTAGSAVRAEPLTVVRRRHAVEFVEKAAGGSPGSVPRRPRWKDDAPLKFTPKKVRADGVNTWSEILACPYFRIQRLDLRAPEALPCDGRSFHILFTGHSRLGIEGGGLAQELAPGVSCLVPAALQRLVLQPASGAASVVVVTL